MALFKHTIAVVMALVFQLAQMAPAVAATRSACAAGAESHCACCAGVCACEAPSDKVPEPAAPPAEGGFKVQPAAMPGSAMDGPLAPRCASVPAVCRARAPVVAVAGFAGVRLAVAFCSWVN